MSHQLLTELYYSGQWNTVKGRDRDPVTITRGQADERSAAPPAALHVTIPNNDRSYSPHDARSPLYGLIGRNTPIRHTLLPGHVTGPLAHVIDGFNRTVSVGWGTEPTSGHVWSGFIAGGAHTASVSPGTAVHGIVAAAAYRGEYLGSILARSVTVGVTFAVDQATGGALEPANILLRGTSINSYVMARVSCETDNSIRILAFSAAGTNLGSFTTSITHAGAGTPLRFEARIVGHRIETRLWNPATTSRPTTPTAVFIDPTSVVAGWVGVRSGIASGNTNTKPVTFSYTNFEALCEVTRVTAEVSSWPPRRDLSGNVSEVTIDASGITRRLGSGTKALRSATYREAVKPANSSIVVGYWSAEDGSAATQIAPGLPTLAPMATFGDMTMASYTELNGSDPLPVLGQTGRLKASVPPYPLGNTFLHAVYNIPTGFPDLPALMHCLATGGTIHRILLWYDTAAGGELNLYVYNAQETLLDQTPAVLGGLAGSKVFISVELVQNGANVDVRLLTWKFGPDGIPEATGFVITDTYPGISIGRVTSFDIGFGAENMTGLAVGHMMVAKNNSLIVPLVSALGGRVYEKAGRRIERLLGEQGIPFSSVGSLDDTGLMGPQVSGKLLDLLQQCADVDGGLLAEEVDDLGMFYRTRRNLENQSPAITMDYTTGLFAPGFGAVPDDQFIHNDVTVSRFQGSSYRTFLDVGPLSVQSPPDGIGEGYEESAELHIGDDLLLGDQAGWRLHKGTIDDDRYPGMAIRLESGRIRTNTSLAAALLSLMQGDVVHVTNVPDSPDAVRLMTFGFADTLTEATARLAFNAVPSRAFDVGVRDNITSGRRDTAGSQVAAGARMPGASGDYASTPDTASLDITGDLDIRCDYTPKDAIPGAEQTLVAKYNDTGNQRSYRLAVETTGAIKLVISTDGINPLTATSTAFPEPGASGRIAVRATLDADNGAGSRVVTFYTSDSVDGTWTQLGTAVTTAGAVTLFSGTADLEVGARDSGTTARIAGVIHAAQVRSGIGGSIVANPDFDAQLATTTVFNDSTGKTWTMHGGATIMGAFAAGTATSFYVVVTSGPYWTVDGADVPFEIAVDGVRLTVTAVGAILGGVQLFTITATPVNGVTKTVAKGKPVNLWRAAVRAL